jgi:tRNA splicing endonuclease
MKRISLIWVSLFLSCTIASLFAQEIAQPEKFYSVQIFSGKDQKTANEVMEKAKSLKYSPVFIIQSEEIFKVKAGFFDNFLDARNIRQSLRNSGYPDAYITWMSPEGAIERLNFIDNIEQALSLCEENISPEKRPFQILEINNVNSYKELSSRIPLKNQIEIADPKLKELLEAENESLTEASINTLQENIQKLSNDNYVKGLCMHKLANVIHQKEKNFENAKLLYYDLANGIVKSPIDIVLNSQIICADISHYFEGETTGKLKSYHQYKESCELADTVSQKQKARVWLEIIGLRMELARCEQGELWECRREVDKFLNSIDESFGKERAVAKLMNFECLCWEEKHDEALKEGEILVNLEGSYKREKATALNYLAGIYFIRGQYDLGKQKLMEVINMDIPENEQWKFKYETWNLKLRAASTGKRFAEHFEKTEDLEEWNRLVERYKNDY